MVHDKTRIRSEEWDTKFSGILKYKQITFYRSED